MEFLPLNERTDRADRRTVGWVVAFAVMSTAGASVWNPLNLDLGPLHPVYLWVALLVTATAVVGVVRWTCPTPALQTAVTLVGALFTCLLASFSAVLVLLVLELDPEEEVLASRGASELVLVHGINVIDPMYRVELRRSVGPVRQTAVVWQGQPEGDRADAARFAGPQEVEVTVPRHAGVVCWYRSTFHLLTLTPDPRHVDGERTGRC